VDCRAVPDDRQGMLQCNSSLLTTINYYCQPLQEGVPILFSNNLVIMHTKESCAGFSVTRPVSAHVPFSLILTASFRAEENGGMYSLVILPWSQQGSRGLVDEPIGTVQLSHVRCTTVARISSISSKGDVCPLACATCMPIRCGQHSAVPAARHSSPSG
jgi:hypothetical protein